MKVDVLARAIESVKEPSGRVVYLSPQGQRLNQQTATRLAAEEHLILLCGHYEGIDERALKFIDEEVSIGDYILTGGELGAMVLVDAVSRLVPGVLGDETSAQDESFAQGLLEYPQYTRPRCFMEMEVPPVLLSGHHEEIRRWRMKLSLYRTLLKRPDLLLNRTYDSEERKLLEEILFPGKKDKGAKN